MEVWRYRQATILHYQHVDLTIRYKGLTRREIDDGLLRKHSASTRSTISDQKSLDHILSAAQQSRYQSVIVDSRTKSLNFGHGLKLTDYGGRWHTCRSVLRTLLGGFPFMLLVPLWTYLLHCCCAKLCHSKTPLPISYFLELLTTYYQNLFLEIQHRHRIFEASKQTSSTCINFLFVLHIPHLPLHN